MARAGCGGRPLAMETEAARGDSEEPSDVEPLELLFPELARKVLMASRVFTSVELSATNTHRNNYTCTEIKRSRQANEEWNRLFKILSCLIHMGMSQRVHEYMWCTY